MEGEWGKMALLLASPENSAWECKSSFAFSTFHTSSYDQSPVNSSFDNIKARKESDSLSDGSFSSGEC